MISISKRNIFDIFFTEICIYGETYLKLLLMLWKAESECETNKDKRMIQLIILLYK